MPVVKITTAKGKVVDLDHDKFVSDYQEYVTDNPGATVRMLDKEGKAQQVPLGDARRRYREDGYRYNAPAPAKSETKAQPQQKSEPNGTVDMGGAFGAEVQKVINNPRKPASTPSATTQGNTDTSGVSTQNVEIPEVPQNGGTPMNWKDSILMQMEAQNTVRESAARTQYLVDSIDKMRGGLKTQEQIDQENLRSVSSATRQQAQQNINQRNIQKMQDRVYNSYVPEAMRNVQGDIQKTVDDMVGNVISQANKDFGGDMLMAMAADDGGVASGISGLQASRERNLKITPSELQKKIESIDTDALAQSLFFENGKIKPWVEQGAKKAGMTPEQYVRNVGMRAIGQQLQASLAKNIDDQYKVKGYGDYLAKKIGDSFVGQLGQMFAATKEQNQMRAQAISDYETKVQQEYGDVVSFMSKAGGFGATMLGDLPLMAGGGWLGGKAMQGAGYLLTPIGRVVGKAASTKTATTIANKVGWNAAQEFLSTTLPKVAQTFSPIVERMGNKALAGRYEQWLMANLSRPAWIGREIARGTVSQSVNMGSFMGVKGAMQQISMGEDNSGEAIFGAFLKGAGHGMKMGAAMGAFGWLGKMAPSFGSRMSRFGAKIGAKGAELGTFIGMDYLDYDPAMNGGKEWSFTDSFIENGAMIVGFGLAGKMTHGVNPIKEWKSLWHGSSTEGLKLTSLERQYLNELFPDEPIFSMPDFVAKEADGWKKAIDAGNQNAIARYRDVQDKFVQMITDKENIPWVVRQKMGINMFSTAEASRPLFAKYEIKGDRLFLRAADNELIDIKEIKNGEDLGSIIQGEEQESRRVQAMNLIAQMGFMEGINAEHQDEVRQILEDICDTYGIKHDEFLTKLMYTRGDKLSDVEVMALDEAYSRMREVVRKANDGKNAPEASAEIGRTTADDVDLVAEEEGITGGTIVVGGDGTPGSKAIAELTARRQQYEDRWNNESSELMDLLEGKGIGEIYATAREDHISDYVANGLLTEEEGRRALEIISNRNNLFNTMREMDAFIERTGEKIDEAVQRRAFEFAHGGLINGELNNAQRIVYATDREGHQYALIDGDMESTTGKVSSESGMVVVKDLLTGESDFKTPDELTVTNIENRVDYEDRLRIELQQRIDQAYGLTEAMGEGEAAGQQGTEGNAPRTEGEAAGQGEGKSPSNPANEGEAAGQGEAPAQPEGTVPPAEGEGGLTPPNEGEGAPLPEGEGNPPVEPEITIPDNVSNPDAFKANAIAYHKGKVEGAADSVRLADGTKLDGRYVLVGSDNLVASHDAETFKQREGAPQREDGKTMNDRDYENDKMAQMSVQQHAANYDERAIQNMPVVTKDGIVISGNDRTMSGQLAGKNGTDAEYTQYLLDHAEKFGFTREQVQEMIDRGEHPRVVLELEADVPYTTETYAQFNKSDMKKRNFVEEAVAQGKVMKEKPELVGKVTAIIEKVENLSDLYNDDDLSKELVQYLVNDGVISKEEVAEWLNDEGMMSDIGKRKFETLMTSIVLDEDAIRLLNNPDYKLGKVRQNIAYSIVELMKNQRLGEYSILDNINKALELYGRAKGAKAKTDRDILSWLAEEDMFSKEAPIDSYTDEEIVLALNMSKGQRQFKAFIKTYNEMAREAANGQTDMFAEGGVKTKEQIIQELAKTLGYDNIQSIREQRARTAQTGEGGTTGEPPRKPDAPGNEEGRGAREGEPGDGVGEKPKSPANTPKEGEGGTEPAGEKPKGGEPMPPKNGGEGEDLDPLTPEGAKKHKENHPLTEAEIERYGEGDDDLIDDAKEYLSGNSHDNNTLSAYEIIYDRKMKAEGAEGEGNEPYSWIDHDNNDYIGMSEEEFQPHANRFIDEYKAVNGTMDGVTSAMQRMLKIGYNKANQARMNYEHPKPKAPESPRSGNEGAGTTGSKKPVSGEQKAATAEKAGKVKSGLAALKAAKEKAKAAQEASKVIGGAKGDEELGSIIGNIGRDPEVASAFREVTNSIAEYGLEVIKEGDTDVEAWKKRVTDDFGEDAKEILEMTDKEWDDYLTDTLATKKVRMNGERKSVAEWMGYHRAKDALEADKDGVDNLTEEQFLERLAEGDKAVKEAEAKGDKVEELINKGALDALKEEYEKRFKNESNEGVSGVGSDGSEPGNNGNEKEPSGEQGDDRGRVPSGTGDEPETGRGATGGVRISTPDDVDPADLPPTGGTGGDTRPSSEEGTSGDGTDGKQPSGEPNGVVSGDKAGADTDNGGGTTEPKPSDSGTPGTDDRSAAERNRAKLGAKVAEALKKGAEKVKYVARSAARAIGSVIPTGMADAVNENLAKFDDIDGFLVSELGYKDKDELHKYLAAEQVDSVALAIKAMQQGYAMVISDQTGVGKGRQAASLLRYAMQQGKTPIFFTERANLINDLYRDMVETGNGDKKPFILADKNKGRIVFNGPDGVRVVEPPTAKEMSYFLTNGKLPKGYDYLVTNYSQINSENSASQKARKEAVKKFAKRNYIIMDESHNAAGQSNTGEYIKGLVNDADGLTFLSATFAKNPSCMPLYAIRSVMADANLEAEQIITAMKVGGVPLQEIVAEALTKSGANIRRERDMEGVKVNWTPMKAEPTVQRQRYDDVITAFRKITDFQDEHIRPIIAKITELAEKQKEHIFYMGNRARLYNLANQMTTAIKVEGVVKEALDALKRGEKVYISMAKTNSAMMDDFFKVGEKVDKADIAKTLLRSLDKCFDYLRIIPSPIPGEEPTKIRERLDLMDLMGESQDAYEALKEELTSLITELPISPIDAIRMALEDAGYKVGEITGRGTMIDRDENGDLIYKKREKQNTNDVIEDYNNGDTDVILMNESGTTGWSGQNSPKFKDKSGIDMGYGEGHRQRHHIVLEPQKDAPTEIQGRGRGDRTGQLSRCIYTYVMSHIPAENRILMMMKKKLATLDAQTTAAGKQQFSEVDTVDFGNKYGSEVVVDILKEDKGLVMELDDPFGWYANVPDGVGDRRRASYISKENDYERVMKRIAMLTTDEQEAFYEQVIERYNSRIETLNATGMNDLETTHMPLDAETLQVAELIHGEAPGSENVFADSAYVEEVEVNVLNKPMTRQEVEASIENSLTHTVEGEDGKKTKERYANEEEYRQSLIDQINEFERTETERINDKKVEDFNKRMKLAEDRIRKQAKEDAEKGKPWTSEQMAEALDAAEEKIRENVERAHKKALNLLSDKISLMRPGLEGIKLGSYYSVPVKLPNGKGAKQVNGIVIGFKIANNKSAATSSVIVATTDGRKTFNIPFRDATAISYMVSQDKNGGWNGEGTNRVAEWDSMVSGKMEGREKRHIITGNLLTAIANGQRGQIVQYTTKDGEVKRGILLPKDVDLSKMGKAKPLIEAVDKVVTNDEAVTTADKLFTIRLNSGKNFDGTYEILINSKSAKRVEKYLDDEDLKKLLYNGDWDETSKGYRAGLTTSDVENVMRHLTDKYNAQYNEALNFDADSQQDNAIKDIKRTKQYGIDTLERYFEEWNSDDETKALADDVFKIARQLGLNCSFGSTSAKYVGGAYNWGKNTITLKYNFFAYNKDSQYRAEVLLHEVIHSVTAYAVIAKEKGKLVAGKHDNLIRAVDELQATYEAIKSEASIRDEYGASSIHEMMAEMANIRFREKLKNINLWDRLRNAVTDVVRALFADFMPERTESAYDRISKNIKTLLDNFDGDLYNEIVGGERYEDEDTSLGDKLDSKRTLKDERKSKKITDKHGNSVSLQSMNGVSYEADGKKHEGLYDYIDRLENELDNVTEQISRLDDKAQSSQNGEEDVQGTLRQRHVELVSLLNNAKNEKSKRLDNAVALRKKYNIDAKTGRISYSDLRRLFHDLNKDGSKELNDLFDACVEKSEALGIEPLINYTNTAGTNAETSIGKQKTIYGMDALCRDRADKNKANDLLHEQVHNLIASLQDFYADPVQRMRMRKQDKAVAEELNRIFKAVAKARKAGVIDKDYYGLSDVYEMIAESRNESFRNALEGIKYDNRSAFRAFVDTIRDWLFDKLGIGSKSAGAQMKDVTSGLDEMLEKVLSDYTDRYANAIIKNANSETREVKISEEDENLSEDDRNAIKELNSGKTKKVYRAMQVIDGKLYPPMAAKVGGELVEGAKQGDILKADEHPELIKIDKSGNPQFVLDKGGKDATGKKATSVPARYNPYWHTSNSMLNDQFKSAWIRPNMVVVEVEIPESELTSGYKAEYAKDAVGIVPWKSGVVTGQLVKQGHPGREVYLSRYCKIGRVVPESEAAQHIKEFIGDRNVEIPVNTVTPKLREALEQAGVKIGKPEKGVKMNEQIEEALERGLEVDNSIRFRTASEEVKNAPREPHHLVVDAAQNAIDALGGKGFVHENKENLPTRANVALAKNPKAMGYYDPKTGEVHIFAFNCPTRYEAERTVQHEKIAHEGLRGLLGKEGYNNFMRDLWMGMDAETRHEVTEKAGRKGWDFYTAMDELMGEKAENFKDDNRTFWQHVKDTWNAVMRGIGFKTSMTEQSIREALWLSKNRLNNKDGNLEYKIRKAAFDFKNKRHVREEEVSGDGRYWGDSSKLGAENEELRLRTMTDEDREKIDLTPSGMMAERQYCHAISSTSYLWTEAHQNNLRSLQILQDSICGKGRVKDTENAFMLLNHLGSKDQQEQQAYQRHLVDPLTKTLQKALSVFDGKKAKDRYQNLEHYVYAKHGLERNRVLDVRDYVRKGMKDSDKAVRDAAEQFGEDFDDLRSQLRTDLDAGAITLAEYFQQMDDFIRAEIPDWEVRDRSGLSDETFDWGNGDGTYDDADVIAHVMDCEAKMGEATTNELWQRIHDLSSFAVGKDYDCGMMNSKAKRRMETMFDWYVPLRGFNEDVAEDMWNYINSEMGGVGKTNMTAKGRVSRADSPIATLVAMGDSAILRGNRNKAKQALVRLARNNQNNLLTEMKVAYRETTDAYGNDVLEPIYPEFREDMTADEIEQAIDDYHVRIENMKAAGEKVTFLTDRRGNVPYRVVRPKDMDQHLITAKINGKDVTLIVHSHPRAAQAVNGLLRNNTNGLGYLKSFNSFMSQLATSRSLTFMARNAIRDYGFATFSTFATEGLKYNKDFQTMYWKLTGKALGNVGSSAMTPSNVNGMMNSMANLFSKYRSKSLDMNNEVERYFKEFVDNGGVTGYVQTKGVDDIKESIDANIAKAYRSKKKKASDYVTKKLFGSYFDLVETINESVENQARFATYYASRKAHRSITRSVNDAKKVSVNFNLTGAGSATLNMKMGEQSTWYKVNRSLAGSSAWFLKNFVWFYNAGVQGMSRSAQVMVGNGVKSAQFAKAVGGFVAVPFAMGMMLPALNAMIAMHDDDDDRKKYGDNPYTQLPEFERRQNLCFYLGHGRFMKIPMAIEGRAFLGLGDIAAGLLTTPDMRSEKNLATQIAEQFTQITPMDIMGGSKVGSNDMAGSILGTVVPSGVQPIIAAGLPGTGFKGTNVSWMGTPISQDGRFNKNDPNFTKANAKTSNGFVKFAEYMNSVSGGDEVTPGAIDIDPSKMEYLLESYGSGPAKDIIETINFLTNAVQTDGNVQGGKVPVLKAVYRNASPANSRNTDRTRWYAFRNEAEATNSHLSKYKTKGMTLEQRMLRDSEEGQRATIVKYYQKRIKKYETQKNKATTRADRDMYQEHINELIHDAIVKIDAIGKE